MEEGSCRMKSQHIPVCAVHAYETLLSEELYYLFLLWPG